MRFDTPAHILTMNPDGTGVRYLGRGDDPGWSPDGTHIVYDSGWADTISTVSVKPVAGGKPKVLASSQRHDGSDHVWQPDWQPRPR